MAPNWVAGKRRIIPPKGTYPIDDERNRLSPGLNQSSSYLNHNLNRNLNPCAFPEIKIKIMIKIMTDT